MRTKNKANKNLRNIAGSLAAVGMLLFTSACSMKSSAELDRVHFAYDAYTISNTEKLTLKKDAEVIRKESGKVVIEGHCDDRGTVEYNVALGEKRAMAVKEYLVATGIGSNRLETKSWGKEKPLDNGKTEKAFAKNRRAEFQVVKSGELD